MAALDWRDLVAVSGWIIGAASLYWAIKQSREARDARRAERQTRELLHRRRSVQQLLGLADGALALHNLIDSNDQTGLQSHALQLAADLSRITSFLGKTLSGEPAKQLDASRVALGGALLIITERGQRTFLDTEKQRIRRHCLDATLSLHALRGHMEMLDELGEN